MFFFQVESILKIHPLVDNVCIYADPSRINTVALLVPDQAALEGLARKVSEILINVPIIHVILCSHTQFLYEH